MANLIAFGALAIMAVSLTFQARGSRHASHEEHRDAVLEAKEEGEEAGKVSMQLAEFAKKFDRAFDELHETNRLFRAHEVQCAERYGRLATNYETVTGTVEKIQRDVSTLQAQISHIGFEGAARSVARRLGGDEPGGR